MGQNNIVPYATGAGANVLSDAAFAALPARFTGLTAGRAPSAVFNKPMRMGSVALSTLGQIAATYGGVDANDDGDVAGLATNLRIALAMMLSGVSYARDTSSVANVVTIALDPAPVSLNSFRSIFVRMANTNTGPVSVAVNNLGSKNATRRDGTALQAGDLPAGVLAHFLYDPTLGQFCLAGLGFAEVQRLIASATFWVRTDGNDANDGSSSDAGHAFGTIAGAITYANRISTTGVPILIRLGNPGTYQAPNQILRPGGRFIIQGDVNNQAGYILQGAGTASNPPVTAYNTDVQLVGVTCNNSGTVADTVAATTFGTLSLTNVTLQMSQLTTPYGHIAAFPNGQVTINGGCIFATSAGSWARSTGGSIIPTQNTLTFSNTPAWSQAGIVITGAGRLQPVGTPTIAGTATGSRFAVYSGTLDSAGQGASFYPGSTAGTASNSTGGYAN